MRIFLFDQGKNFYLISWSILFTCLLDDVWILLGEVTSWSLLRFDLEGQRSKRLGYGGKGSHKSLLPYLFFSPFIFALLSISSSTRELVQLLLTNLFLHWLSVAWLYMMTYQITFLFGPYNQEEDFQKRPKKALHSPPSQHRRFDIGLW